MKDYIINIISAEHTSQNTVKVSFTVQGNDMGHSIEIPLELATTEGIQAKIRSELPRLLDSQSSIRFNKIAKEIVYTNLKISCQEKPCKHLIIYSDDVSFAGCQKNEEREHAVCVAAVPRACPKIETDKFKLTQYCFTLEN